jgi:hypothetical protein
VPVFECVCSTSTSPVAAIMLSTEDLPADCWPITTISGTLGVNFLETDPVLA